MPHRLIGRWFNHPPPRLGYRGSILLALGVAWVVLGARVWISPGSLSDGLLHELLPLPLRVALWIITGVLAVVAAFKRTPGDDWFGFAALLLPLVLRSVSYLWSTVTWVISVAFTDMTLGAPRAALGAIIWIAFAEVVLICAGWPEPPTDDDRR